MTRRLIFQMLLLVATFGGCLSSDLPIPANYGTYPIDLKVEERADGTTILTWNKIKSSDFIEYWVVRTHGADSLLYVSSPAVLPTNMELVTKIADVDSTTLIDSVNIPTRNSNLRVFALLNGRNLSSHSVSLKNAVNISEADSAPDDVVFIPEKNWLTIIDRSQFLLSVYDFQNSLLVGSTFTAIIGGSEANYGRNLGTNLEVYFLRGGVMGILNIENFNTFQTSINQAATSVFSDYTDLMFGVSLKSSTIFLNSFRRSSGLNLQSFSFTVSGVTTNQVSLKKYPLSKKAFIVMQNNTGVPVWFPFQYDSTGNFTKTLGFIVAESSIRPFVISPDEQRVVTHASGIIYDISTSVTKKGKLADQTKATYLDIIFSTDGTRLYALRDGAKDRAQRRVDVFKYPDFQLEKSLTFRSTPSRIFQNGQQLLLVGISPNNPRRTMIEKLNL